MNKALLVALMLAIASCQPLHAKEEAKVTYVGQGRYTCTPANSPQCAQVRSNNDLAQERTTRDYERSQDAANAYVDRERRKEEDRSLVRDSSMRLMQAS